MSNTLQNQSIKPVPISIVRLLENQVGEIFNYLRGEVREEDYDVVLFILWLYKEGIISEDLLDHKEGSKQQLIDQLSAYGKTKSLSYQTLLEVYTAKLQSISEFTMPYVLHELKYINKRDLTNSFSQLFESVLFKIKSSQGKMGGAKPQPNWISQLASLFAGEIGNASVFNPFAGFASFGIALKSDRYLGQEINREVCALGNLRLLAHGNDFDSKKILTGNSFLDWPKQKEFDLIVAYPPFGMPNNHPELSHFPKHGFTEFFTLNEGYNSLTAKGTIISVVPNSFLFTESKHVKGLREKFINQGELETVISFPGGLLPDTSAYFSMLVISKESSLENVTFVDAAKYVVQDSRLSSLDYERLFEDVSNAKKGLPFDNIKLVSNGDIREQDYLLSFARYELEIIDGVRLGDILSQLKLPTVKLPYSGKQVRTIELTKGLGNRTLQIDSLEVKELTRGRNRILKGSAFLVSLIGSNLKATHIEESNDELILGTGVEACELSHDRVDPQYLANELDQDYVMKQLQSFRLGSTISHLRFRDLLNVVVKLPPLSEQKAKVKGLLEISRKIQMLEQEKWALVEGRSEDLYQGFSTIKHALGSPMAGIHSGLVNMEFGLDSFDKSWRDHKIGTKNPMSLGDVLASLKESLRLIGVILQKNDNHFDVSSYPLEPTDIIQFYRKYIKKLRPKLGDGVELKDQLDEELKSKDLPLISSNADLLEIALNLIVENAQKHAFIDPFTNHQLGFSVSLEESPMLLDKNGIVKNEAKSFIKFTVANSGKPFPKGFSKDEFVRLNSRKGDNANTGQGGFQLNEIVKYHNDGKSKLRLHTDNPSAAYKTIVEFVIPIN